MLEPCRWLNCKAPQEEIFHAAHIPNLIKLWMGSLLKQQINRPMLQLQPIWQSSFQTTHRNSGAMFQCTPGTVKMNAKHKLLFARPQRPCSEPSQRRIHAAFIFAACVHMCLKCVHINVVYFKLFRTQSINICKVSGEVEKSGLLLLCKERKKGGEEKIKLKKKKIPKNKNTCTRLKEKIFCINEDLLEKIQIPKGLILLKN